MRWPNIQFLRKGRGTPGGEHLPDEEILMAVDGELEGGEMGRVQSHLAACWVCRSRKAQLERTIGEFVEAHREALDPQLPPSAGPTASLKTRLSEASVESGDFFVPRIAHFAKWNWALATGCAALAVAFYFVANPLKPGLRSSGEIAALVVPNASLTPGAAVRLTSGQICRERPENNRMVPVALQREVFAAYGIMEAEPRAYEVDYLITPALGGADDIHNMWPQAYSAVWNARVKDALEDRLREMVCSGDLDLATAQKEISNDWIAAYKKYFQTDQPIETR